MSNWKQNAVSDRALEEKKKPTETPALWSNRQNTIIRLKAGEDKQSRGLG